MRAALWGRDQTELGSVAVELAGDRLAAALTRGLQAKRYEYVDANEDVVVAVAGPRASLLAVADGHNGAEASEVAIRVVLERLGEDPPEVAGRLPRGSVDLEPGDWVVALTDGFTSFAPLRDLLGILSGSESPAAAVQRIIEHAGAHGAGDNVAVALAAPQER